MVRCSMKILFLYFDGVLNYQKYLIEKRPMIIEFCNINHNNINDIPVMFEKQMLYINLDNLSNLIYIIRKTHAKVVVTSSWKTLEVFPLIMERLKSLGVPIIDVTYDDGMNRGEGIKNYLMQHEVKNYLILDDEIFPDYDDELIDHLVQPSFYEDGLNKMLAKEAVDRLNDKKVLVKKRKPY